jgi:hypothetical protein
MIIMQSMGGNVWQQSNIKLPMTEQEGGWLKSHKHHKSTETMVSGGDPKRELVPPVRQK